MKIGIDARSLSVTEPEGMHVYAFNVIKRLTRLDPNIECVLYSDRPIAPAMLESLGARYSVRILSPKWFWPQTRLTAEFYTPKTKNKFDVFYFPTQSMSFYCPKPTVAVIHDLAFLKFPDYFTAWNRFVLSKLTTNFTVRLATKLIAISEQTKQDAMEFYNIQSDKIQVIHHGFDSELYYQRSQTEIKTVTNRYGIRQPYLIYVGTLQKRKNISRLIEAFAWLKQTRQIPHQMVIIGKKGWLYQDIFKAVKSLQIESEVVLTGYAPRADVPALLSGSSAFILPSLYEGFGLPVIEAMASGAPAVVARNSALSEIGASAANYIDEPLDIQSIGQAIWSVISDSKKQNDLRQAGLKRAQDFSWDACARDTLEIIRRAARQV